jgi:hypothetical protein
MENARFTAGLLIAAFHRAAPAHCGASGDERASWPAMNADR